MSNGEERTPTMNDQPNTSRCAQADGSAEVSISRVSNPEAIRIRVEIGRDVLDLEMPLAEFALCLTGRGATPAEIKRRFTRPNTPVRNAGEKKDNHAT